MARYLCDIALNAADNCDKKREFKLETNFLERLYLQALPKVPTHGIGKVIVEINHIDAHGAWRFETMIDVMRASRDFDCAVHWRKDKEERKRAALVFLKEGLIAVASRMKWDQAPFEQAYLSVLSRPLVYQSSFKAKPNTDKSLRAVIEYSYDSDGIAVWVIIVDRRGNQVAKRHVANTLPGNVFLSDAVAQAEWVAQWTFTITSRNGEVSSLTVPH